MSKEPTTGESVARAFDVIAGRSKDGEMEEVPVMFGHQPSEGRYINGGVQYCFAFDNGYGASVVKHSFSYGHEAGKWELGVLDGENLTNDTPITDDVIGWMSEEDVEETLKKIAELPRKKAQE